MAQKQVSTGRPKHLLRRVQAALAVSIALGISACATPSSSTPISTSPPPITYTPEQLHTGNPTYDAYDSEIIQYTAANNIPDPMLIKAEIDQESTFNTDKYNEENPCNYDDFVSTEDGSWSLMQVNRGCTIIYHPTNIYATNPNGTFNSAEAVNPTYTLAYTMPLWSSNLSAFKAQIPGCTEATYLIWALAEWNAGTPKQAYTSCTDSAYDPRNYVPQVLDLYGQLAKAAGWEAPFNYTDLGPSPSNSSLTIKNEEPIRSSK